MFIMPFGLKNDWGSFQGLITFILSTVRWQYALFYLDEKVDLSKSSKSVEEHMMNQLNLLKLLEASGVTMKINKCRFFSDTI